MATKVVSKVKRLAPSASKITNEIERKHYWGMILNLWHLPAHIQHFPGANPMSIERSDFDRLESDDFLAALKTDGVRHLLLLCCKPNSDDPIAIMIDRALTMYEVEIWANEDFFKLGSLFDGELVWERHNLVFIVFDVMFVRGVTTVSMAYRERLQILHNTILCVSESHPNESVERMIVEENKFLARNNLYDMRIVPKKCVVKANLRSLWEERGTMAHRNDGIIFTLNGAPVDTGTSPSILKWKPSHSIDVKLTVNDEGKWCIFGNTNDSNHLFDMTDVFEQLTVVLAPCKLLDAIRARQPCIVECVIKIEGDELRLVPERERTDKTSPNTLKTISATLRNAREDISCDELVTLVRSL